MPWPHQSRIAPIAVLPSGCCDPLVKSRSMEKIGVYEAKARLSELIERAEQGAEFVITRHGKAVARLVPARSSGDPEQAAAIREILEFGKTVKAKPFDLREALESGRK